MSTPSRPLDLAHLTEEEIKLRLGELVLLSLQQKGSCVFLAKKPGQITLLDPEVLDVIPDEEWASRLLAVWDEEEVETFLEARYREKAP